MKTTYMRKKDISTHDLVASQDAPSVDGTTDSRLTSSETYEPGCLEVSESVRVSTKINNLLFVMDYLSRKLTP